ncbi:hypothetical protein Tco_0642046, partial [Tanacetum coccineum]
SPPLPVSSPVPVLPPSPPTSPICSLGYRAAMIRLRAKAASTSHSLPLPPPFILSPTRSDAPSLGIPPPLPISVPTSSPPLLLPSASYREDKPEVTLPPWKRLGIALSPGYEVGESSSAAAARPARGLRADYGFVATMDREIRRDPERLVGYGITESDAVITGTGYRTTGTAGTRLESSAQPRDAKGWLGSLMETVFRISNCPVENQVKFSTCTLLADNDRQVLMSRNEMKKLEAKLWNLKVKGTDVIGYNQRFQELALLCVRMFPEEFDKIERLRTKGSLKTLLEIIKTNNNRTRDRTLAGPILQGLVKRSLTGDLNPYALNATITTTVRVLQNATNATKLAILVVTVGVWEMLTMLTIRGVLGQAKNLLASSVEFKDTSRGNAQS